MKRAIIAFVIMILSVAPAYAGTRADLSGDAVIDFQTTMDMPFVTVGNPGNSHDRVYGDVDYQYNIGKFEVTAGQYTEFLNAVAATDTYGLYSEHMSDVTNWWGCNIQRSGSSGSYAYSVPAEWEDRPVNYISWGDAARFCNWMTNGMPSGTQNLSTTEDGSYFLNGATTNEELCAVTRDLDARYVIPSEDEWYKAAYHKNDGVTGNYFDYPTCSDTVPSNVLSDPDPGNNANYDYPWSIGSPYYRTEVGEFENSPSPYGAYDMGGNVWEWTETALIRYSSCVWRGGSFDIGGPTYLHAENRYFGPPESGNLYNGFRVSEVPEPGSAGLFLTAILPVLRRRKS
jgi:formylglycine-generating enzyme required for sulfatase activity